MLAIKFAPRTGQESGRSKPSESMSGDVSPDSKCPICLDAFKNVAVLNRCLHKFCFFCILEWSKNKPECPLCKQPFNLIYHSIKSDNDFQRHEIKQSVNNAAFGFFEGLRFRYRTTLTNARQQYRRTPPPTDVGILFEGSRVPSQLQRDYFFQHTIKRLVTARRAANENRAGAHISEEVMIRFRRELYRRGLRIINVLDRGRTRDISAAFFRINPACLHRLVPWLQRELIVLFGGHSTLARIVQHTIMTHITLRDMEDEAILGEIRPFLQSQTEHFMHEFISFAKSPFNIEAHDQNAVYDYPGLSLTEGNMSNSSAITISEDEESIEVVDLREGTSTLSHSLWDDETPGPSYTVTSEPSRSMPLAFLTIHSYSSSDEESQPEHILTEEMSSSRIGISQVERNTTDLASSDSDDCIFVGFTKPTAERTPEMILLSSDLDESLKEETVPFPKHIRFTSCSPRVPYSRCPDIDGESNLEANSLPNSQTFTECVNQSLASKTHCENEFFRRSNSKNIDAQRKKRTSRERRSQEAFHCSVRPHYRERKSSSYKSRNSPNHDRSYERRESFYQPYSSYRKDKNDHVAHHSHRKFHYYNYPRYSRSYSSSPSRYSRRRDRGRSRSRTYSSSRSPSVNREFHNDKPGGKRTCKSKHLENSSKERHSYREGDSMSSSKHKKKSKEKRRKKSRERSRRSSSDVDEAWRSERSKRHHKKKKHKKKSKRHKSDERKERSSL